MGDRNPRANLVIHHGVADILGQTAELVHILGGVQEPCDLASLCQRDEVLKDIIQFPDNYTSDWIFTLERGELLLEDRPPLFFLDLTLGNRRAQRSCQPFNSGYQWLDRLATCHCCLVWL